MKIVAVLAIIIMLAAGCSSGSSRGGENALPRAQPAFMQWMMRQSMREQADSLAAEVSQSGRLWLNSGSGNSPAVLLKVAPDWLEVNARSTASRQPLFRMMAAEADNIARFGFGGIYLGPTGERPEIWVGHELDKGGAGGKLKTFGHDSASINKFDPAAGAQEDFDLLSRKAESAHLQLGSDLVGAATGIGPDFILTSRKARGYDGLYAMMPVPQDLWKALPQSSDEWDFQALDDAATATLKEKGVLPSGVGRDGLKWASHGGWAVTGPVMGVDGRKRRWVYRYTGGPDRPVMLWHDPSGGAKRIFSGDIIANTGLNRESLVGIRLEPLMGLEAEAKQPDMRNRMEPALEALEDMAREIHRYGGWSIQADALPASAMEEVLAGACDFCRDAVTPALVAYALLNKDALPLASQYDEWLKKEVDQSRLGRGFNDVEGINWKILAQEEDLLQPAAGPDITASSMKTDEILVALQESLPETVAATEENQELELLSVAMGDSEDEILPAAGPENEPAVKIEHKTAGNGGAQIEAAPVLLAQETPTRNGDTLLRAPSTLRRKPASESDARPGSSVIYDRPIPPNYSRETIVSPEKSASSPATPVKVAPEPRVIPAETSPAIQPEPAPIEPVYPATPRHIQAGSPEKAAPVESALELKKEKSKGSTFKVILAPSGIEASPRPAEAVEAKPEPEPVKETAAPEEKSVQQVEEKKLEPENVETAVKEESVEQEKAAIAEENEPPAGEIEDRTKAESESGASGEEEAAPQPGEIDLAVMPGLGREPETFEEILRKVFSGIDGKNADYGALYNIFYAWRLGLPGVAFINSSELEQMGENFAGSILSSSRRDGARGNFLATLRALLAERKKSELANGRLVAVSNGNGGACGVLSQLPSGGYWFMASNFGDKRANVEINLPQKARKAKNAVTGASLSSNLKSGGGKFLIALDAYQAVHVLLTK